MSLSVFAVEEWEKLKIAEKEFEELMSHRLRFQDSSDEDEETCESRTVQRNELENKETKEATSKLAADMDFRDTSNKSKNKTNVIPENPTSLFSESIEYLQFLRSVFVKMECMLKDLDSTKRSNTDYDMQQMVLLFVKKDARDRYIAKSNLPVKFLKSPPNMTTEDYLNEKKVVALLVFRQHLIEKIIGRKQFPGLDQVHGLFSHLFGYFNLPMEKLIKESRESMLERYSHVTSSLP